MVEQPEDYPWSSHRAYLGSEHLPWLTTDWVLSLFSDRENLARERYKAFVAEAVEEGRRSEYHRGTCDGRILGDDAFADEVLSRACQHGYQKYSYADVLASVCRCYRISEEDLRSPGKTRPYNEARAVAALIVKDTLHLSLTNLAMLLDRDVAALGKAVIRIKRLAENNLVLANHIEEIRAEVAKCPKV